MCPDRDLLSAYADDEVPSPWKEKLERHLDDCAACADRVGRFRTQSSALSSAPEGDLVGAADRVWAALSQRMASDEETPGIVRGGMWVRRVSVPLPAAAAALLAIAFFAVLILAPGRRANLETIASVESTTPQAVQVSDVAGMIKSLSAQDSGADIIVIRLPDAATFEVSGQPALIRAADYNPNASGR